MRRATNYSVYINTPTVFQSTLSMRRATPHITTRPLAPAYISIHALHEESDACRKARPDMINISIHALHEESDPTFLPVASSVTGFQSTLSMRRATQSNGSRNCATAFQSTLSMRRATNYVNIGTDSERFQSTLSMRRATAKPSARPTARRFQSTLSMRRATARVQILAVHGVISIHALHEESDSSARYTDIINLKFQSTLSMRRATGGEFTRNLTQAISIHALHEESDGVRPLGRRRMVGHFNPRSP